MNETELLNLLRPRALRWLAQREHSEPELRRKVARLARAIQQQTAALAAAPSAEVPLEGARLPNRRRHTAALSNAKASTVSADQARDVGELGGGDVRPVASKAAEYDDDGSVPTVVAPVVDQLIEWLRERHYLSDQRFVESRIRTRQSRFGLQRIQQELSQHGLSLGEAERQHLNDTELQRAHHVWARKFGPELPQDSATRATQSRFLMQRGFSTGVIRQVLKGTGFAAEVLPE